MRGLNSRQWGILLFGVLLAGSGVVAGTAVELRWRIAFDPMKTRCLPWSWYLVDLGPDSLQAGDYLLFATQQSEPHFPNGTPFVKQIAAVAGDRFVVRDGEVRVNDRFVAALNPTYVAYLKQPVNHYDRDQVLARGEYAVLGSTPQSFDSRYWGPIRQSQVLGRARPLW